MIILQEKQPMESSHLNKSKNKVILKPLIIRFLLK